MKDLFDLEETEEWKPIPNLKGIYYASTFGRIKSIARITLNNMTVKERILKPQNDRHGYLRVPISIEKTYKSKYIHQLIGLTFHPNPENKPHINHKDGNPWNNHVKNLEWCTPLENNTHSFQNKFRKFKLTDEEIDKIRNEYIPYKNGVLKLSKKYNVSKSWVWDIIKGENGKGNPFKFVKSL